MKLSYLIAIVSLAASAATFAADKHEHGHAHTPLHGGVVVEVKDVDYELVATKESLRLFVRDHGKAVPPAQSTAKVTLLAGTEKQEASLTPAGDHLAATGNFRLVPNTKAVVVIVRDGKSATARFVLK